MILSIATFAVLTGLGIYGYVRFAERSGKAPEGEHLETISASPNFENGQFNNLTATSMSTGEGSMLGSAYKWLFEGTDRRPSAALPTGWNTDEPYAIDTTSPLNVTWFGHSTVLLSIEGKRVMLDPMLSGSSATIPGFGKRYATDRPIPVDQMPELDLVIISHDHYDHLDIETIAKLNDRIGHYVVPLGVSSHLEHWGVAANKITELDWWDRGEIRGLSITATPSRHFSGRSIPNSNPTLWASWVILGKETRVFFSGDGGYSDSFREIGEEFGPFDLTLMEYGQYNDNWSEIHWMPEQSVQAHVDLGGKVLMPIHWGAFDLSLHSLYEPPTRLAAEAERVGVKVAVPLIGQTFTPDHQNEELYMPINCYLSSGTPVTYVKVRTTESAPASPARFFSNGHTIVCRARAIQSTVIQSHRKRMGHQGCEST